MQVSVVDCNVDKYGEVSFGPARLEWLWHGKVWSGLLGSGGIWFGMALTRQRGTESMRVAIVGSRSFGDEWQDRVDRLVDALPEDSTIVSGGARGPDQFAERAARRRGLKYFIHPVPRKEYASGYEFAQAANRRNADIVQSADCVVAFYDGESKGTLDTIKKAREADVPLLVITALEQLEFFCEQVASGGVLRAFTETRDKFGDTGAGGFATGYRASATEARR